MLHVVLYQPEIPQNTGNIGRMCALTGSRLHLIHPLGFKITDAHLRRAGMDYWRSLDVHEHADWRAFRASASGPGPAARLWLFTTRAKRSFWSVAFSDGDALVFGNEGSGAPEWLHAEIGAGERTGGGKRTGAGERVCGGERIGAAVADWRGGRVTIPHANPALRSLNLSTAAGIACYEALRQTGLLGGAVQGQRP